MCWMCVLWGCRGCSWVCVYAAEIRCFDLTHGWAVSSSYRCVVQKGRSFCARFSSHLTFSLLVGLVASQLQCRFCHVAPCIVTLSLLVRTLHCLKLLQCKWLG